MINRYLYIVTCIISILTLFYLTFLDPIKLYLVLGISLFRFGVMLGPGNTALLLKISIIHFIFSFEPFCDGKDVFILFLLNANIVQCIFQ